MDMIMVRGLRSFGAGTRGTFGACTENNGTV